MLSANIWLFFSSARQHSAEKRRHSVRAASAGSRSGVAASTSTRSDVATGAAFRRDTTSATFRRDTTGATFFGHASFAVAFTSVPASSLAACASMSATGTAAAIGRVVVASASHKRDARAERDHSEQAS